MSESDCLTGVEKKDAEKYNFSSDNSSHSTDINNQITIQVFTQGQEENQFVGENSQDKDVGDQWINKKREKDEVKDGDMQNGGKDSDNQEKEVNDGEMWAEEGKVLGLGDKGGNDGYTDDCTGTEKTELEDESCLNMEQEKHGKNDAIGGDEVEDGKLTQVSSDGSQDRVTSEDINETYDDIKQDSIPAESNENTKPSEKMVTNMEVDGKEETEVQISSAENTRLVKGVSMDAAAEDKHIVQELLIPGVNAQCKNTNDGIAVDADKNKDTNILVSKKEENSRLSEGTVEDNNVRICKGTPDVVNSDHDNDSPEPTDNYPESKGNTDTQSTAHNIKLTGANSRVQSDDVDMKWESDTNTSEWETGMFVTEVGDNTSQVPECQPEKEDDSSTFPEENTDILENCSKDSGSENIREMDNSIGVSSENDKIVSERVVDDEVSDEVEKKGYQQTQQNDDQQVLPNHSDAAQEEQLRESVESADQREGVQSEEEEMHEEECKSQSGVSSVIQSDEQERDISATDNACEEKVTKVHKRITGQKRKNKSANETSNKKSMKNIERVKQKLEEIMEKSKAEEDRAIAELQKMKQEKAEVLELITTEMEVLKSLLAQGKVHVLKKS
ncbi:PWWP domain-containing protein 3-like [Penaeus chinensis]|uniref:PWWP domain-containing protein 3-like n=1 Tax=Penaeus chinensis TaxID=139456 RepID=UPI001FB5730A|nr:PWWP domain-containing protein 3-like [Penaeus chinensis]